MRSSIGVPDSQTQAADTDPLARAPFLPSSAGDKETVDPSEREALTAEASQQHLGAHMTGTDRNVRLTRKQLDALAALAVSSTTREAAEKTGVSERTLRRWLASDSFLRRYREQSQEINGQALSALRSAQVWAVEVLREGLTSDVPAIRVRSASRLLEYGLKVRDRDIEERITELERRADKWQG